MKRFLVILLSMGLVAVFSLSAMAVDVKFSGSYYVAGLYLDKTSFVKDNNLSTAFYFQRLRLRTDFVVSPGLSLTTQADIMERSWGGPRSTPGSTPDTLSAGTRAENENIAFDLLYLTYQSPIGVFMVGYMYDGLWGNDFASSATVQPKVVYMIQAGGLRAAAMIGKYEEKSYSAVNTTATASDRDSSMYSLWAMYSWKDGRAGLIWKYVRNAGYRDYVPGVAGFLQDVHFVSPTTRVKFGPLTLEAELMYIFGKAQKWEGRTDLLPGGASLYPDVTVSQLFWDVEAKADFGRFYVGGILAYVGGDDPATKDKWEGGVLDGGYEWNPCLLLFNSDVTYWAGTQSGWNASSSASYKFGTNAGPMTNAYLAQLSAGVRPIDKLDVRASVSYATADKVPTVWASREYGYEVDLTATYKLTNNLSYMLGGAYLFTGDYFKGANSANEINNNYLLINKLTLTF